LAGKILNKLERWNSLKTNEDETEAAIKNT
jgi:hypothetical protein